MKNLSAIHQRAVRIAAPIHETEPALGMHRTPSPSPVTA